MRNLLLLRFGEIFLKGLNRPYFMRELVKRVREAVKPTGGRVWLHDGRIFVSDFDDLEETIRRVTKVFGVHSVCPALEMPRENFDDIAAQAIALMAKETGTFKVVARRADKRYPMTSMEINQELGARLLESNPNLKVDIHHPQHVLNVEIRDVCYLYNRIVPAVGGMPVGTNGQATLLLSGGIDSPVAGWMIAKRGVQLNAVHFFSYPYTSDRAKEKVLSLARILSESCCGMKVYVVPFTKIQMQIHTKCPDEYGTLIMRRFMMRIAERIARQTGSQALITGESIGQVASQTMDALTVTDSVVEMPVFRPLIGFDKSDIIDIANKIGTFETSSLPYEDCCTVFTPRHPATHPKLEKAIAGEAALEDAEALIQEAVDGVEIIDCGASETPKN